MRFHLSRAVLLLAALSLSGCGEEKKAMLSPQPAVAPAATPINLETVAKRLNAPAFSTVDGVNGVTLPPSGSVIPVSEEKLRIGGFAVDAVKGEPAAGVLVLIDDKPHLAIYGGERPDIAQALNNPKYLKSQFYYEAPAESVGKGIHDLKIRVVSSDKTGYYESAWSAKIDVK